MTDPDRPEDRGSRPDGVIRTTYDWSSTAPSTAVVETVAVATDREPTAIEPLYESIDPDALDTVVRSNGPRRSESEITVAFAFGGRNVTVRCDGTVVVRPAEERSGPE